MFHYKRFVVNPIEENCYIIWANQVDNTALHDHFRKDCFCAFLKSGYAVHRDETDFLNASCLEFVENLHPSVFALTVLYPKSQNFLAPVDSNASYKRRTLLSRNHA